MKTDEIKTIALVEDDPDEIQSTRDELEDAGFDVHVLTPPFPDLDELVRRIRGVAQLAVVDHKLGWHGVVTFDGATAVARLVKAGFPALLLTSFTDPDFRAIRIRRQWVPRVVRRSEASLEVFRDAVDRTVAEVLRHRPPPDRRPERVLIRIKDISDSEVIAIIPGWNSRDAVSIPRTLVQPPELLDGLGAGDYLIAQVNIGAQAAEDLFFGDFEQASEPAEI